MGKARKHVRKSEIHNKRVQRNEKNARFISFKTLILIIFLDENKENNDIWKKTLEIFKIYKMDANFLTES